MQCVDTWKQNNCQLTVPKEIDVSSQMLLCSLYIAPFTTNIVKSRSNIYIRDAYLADFVCVYAVGGKICCG